MRYKKGKLAGNERRASDDPVYSPYPLPQNGSPTHYKKTREDRKMKHDKADVPPPLPPCGILRKKKGFEAVSGAEKPPLYPKDIHPTTNNNQAMLNNNNDISNNNEVSSTKVRHGNEREEATTQERFPCCVRFET